MTLRHIQEVNCQGIVKNLGWDIAPSPNSGQGKKLRIPEQPPTDEEIRQAALQFVRKVSGYRLPSRRNQQPFDLAVEEISLATRRLLDNLETAKT